MHRRGCMNKQCDSHIIPYIIPSPWFKNSWYLWPWPQDLVCAIIQYIGNFSRGFHFRQVPTFLKSHCYTSSLRVLDIAKKKELTFQASFSPKFPRREKVQIYCTKGSFLGNFDELFGFKLGCRSYEMFKCTNVHAWTNMVIPL